MAVHPFIESIKFCIGSVSFPYIWKEVIAMKKSLKVSQVLFYILISIILLLAVLFLLQEEGKMPFAHPSMKTDRSILVIDAGHGGADGGAVSVTGTRESVINLDISLRLAALAGLTGTDFVLTRSSEEIDYPPEATTISKMKKFDQKQRVELINSVPNGVLMSVHQNFFPHKSPRGPQAFYAKSDGSDSLAVMVQAGLSETLYPGNRRLAVPVANTIYIYKNISCPAVLVECGFLSNCEEAKLLDTGDYRLKIAATLCCAYLQYLAENK